MQHHAAGGRMLLLNELTTTFARQIHDRPVKIHPGENLDAHPRFANFSDGALSSGKSAGLSIKRTSPVFAMTTSYSTLGAVGDKGQSYSVPNAPG